MIPQFRGARLTGLSALELFEILQARAAVFVVEQRCAYQDPDTMDLHAWHLTVRLGHELAAYARVVDPGIKSPLPSIGRVMTLPRFRTMKLGRPLVTEAIRWIESHFPGLGIQIGAQVYLRAFYESLGFQGVGDAYDEDGIAHLDMVRPAVVSAP